MIEKFRKKWYAPTNPHHCALGEEKLSQAIIDAVLRGTEWGREGKVRASRCDRSESRCCGVV